MTFKTTGCQSHKSIQHSKYVSFESGWKIKNGNMKIPFEMQLHTLKL